MNHISFVLEEASKKALQMRSRKSNELDLPHGPIWFKVTGMLQQNWAMVVEEKNSNKNKASIYFFDDHGEVFDLLFYPIPAQADHALAFNGFTPLDDEPGFRAIAGYPHFPLVIRERGSRPVYSSGEYWHQPPDIDQVTRRRSITAKGLERFVQAQNPVIDVVKSELLLGVKRTHWMWFVFPQIFGLGHSFKAKKYGITNLDEASEYLSHPLLGSRLRECFRYVLKHSDRTAEEIFGHIDAKKFRSCATLFKQVDRSENSEFAQAIKIFYKGKPDRETLDSLYG